MTCGVGHAGQIAEPACHPALTNDNPMKFLKMLSKPAAWVSGWSSAALCFSAATGYWLAGERGRALCWVALGAAEVIAIAW